MKQVTKYMGIAMVLLLVVVFATPTFALDIWTGLSGDEVNRITQNYPLGTPHSGHEWELSTSGNFPPNATWDRIGDQTGRFSWLPGGNEAGTYLFALTAWDHHTVKTYHVTLIVNNTYPSSDPFIYEMIEDLDIRLDAAENDIDDLQDAMANAEADIVTLQGQMATAQSQIGSLQIQMATAQADIDALEGRMTNAEEDINALQHQVWCLKWQVAHLYHKINCLEHYIQWVDCQSRFRDHLLGMWNLYQQCQINGIILTVAELDERVTATEKDVDKLEVRADEFWYSMAQLDNSIFYVKYDITNMKTQFTTITGNIVTISQNISNLETKLLKAISEGDTATATAVNTQLVAFKTDLLTQMSLLQSWINELDSELTECLKMLQEADAGLNGRIDALKSSFESLKKDLQGQIDGVKKSIIELGESTQLSDDVLQKQIDSSIYDSQMRDESLQDDIDGYKPLFTAFGIIAILALCAGIFATVMVLRKK